jgi:5-methylcytosine-specific restriction endonuclease McrA
MKVYTEEQKERNKAKNKAWKRMNKDKVKAHNKAYYENNRDKVKAKHKAYYENNRDKLVAYTKAYYENNKERKKAKNRAWKKNNRDKLVAYHKSYKENNRDKVNAYMYERKCRKIFATCETSIKAKREMIYLIASEIGLETGIDHDVDHIIPISKGGINHEDFLMVITQKYNRQKGAKLDYPLPETQYLILDDFVQLYLEEVK